MRGAPDDFYNEAGMLFDGHTFNETMVVYEIGTVLGVLL